MATIIRLEKIKSILENLDLVTAIEEGFVQYSNNNTVVPPVGELLFEEPKGEAHIKYGYIKNDDYFVIKIASGFYDNVKLGISSSQGLMLIFSQKTGEIKGVLLDEGYLTNIRTAAAGAVIAKYFGPKNIKSIGIIGTGIQGRLQLEYLQKISPCKIVWVWDRHLESAERFKNELKGDYEIHIAKDTSEIGKHCNFILTTTPSEMALIKAADIQAGTHITAVGSDTPEKQELESAILQKAAIVISDSIPQSKSRGEIYRATTDGAITADKVVELGTAIQNSKLHRSNENQITVADLTGVAVQDIVITKAVYLNYIEANS